MKTTRRKFLADLIKFPTALFIGLTPSLLKHITAPKEWEFFAGKFNKDCPICLHYHTGECETKSPRQVEKSSDWEAWAFVYDGGTGCGSLYKNGRLFQNNVSLTEAEYLEKSVCPFTIHYHKAECEPISPYAEKIIDLPPRPAYWPIIPDEYAETILKQGPIAYFPLDERDA